MKNEGPEKSKFFTVKGDNNNFYYFATCFRLNRVYLIINLISLFTNSANYEFRG